MPVFEVLTSIATVGALLAAFERVQVALDRDLLDRDALHATLGFHIWWWGTLLARLRGPKASVALHELRAQSESWARDSGRLDEWAARCMTDFNGGSASAAMRVAGATGLAR